MEKIQTMPLVALYFCVVILLQFYFGASSKPTGFNLKLIPRDSPGSPLYPGNLTYTERIERSIRFSKVRRYYSKNLSRPNAMMEPAENIYLRVLNVDFAYFVYSKMGTEETSIYPLLDTGGGLIWTQCDPCKNCYPQDSPIYDSRSSNTYRRLTCDHPFCSGDYPLYNCVNNECIYDVVYGDRTSTHGIASLEKFKFAVSASQAVFVDNIVFGCSNDTRNFKFGQNKVITGVLGMSKSPDSLISQLSSIVSHRFSYCFPPFIQLQQAYSVLRFGDGIPPPSENFRTTRFVTVPGGYYYYLNLLDISIRAVRLGFEPGHFQVKQDGSGGLFIDSGAIITRIDRTIFGERSAYDSLIALFKVYYDAKKLQRKTDGPTALELCYEHPPGFNDFADMTYHFEGADYRVEPQYVHWPDDLSVGYFCVALVPGDGVSILGAWHQQNMRITYDLNIDGLQFAPENCINDDVS